MYSMPQTSPSTRNANERMITYETKEINQEKDTGDKKRAAV